MAVHRRVAFLTRRNCSICGDALADLKIPAFLFGIHLDVVDIDAEASEDTRERYAGRVPVLLTDAGEVLAEGRMSKRKLWQAARRARFRRS